MAHREDWFSKWFDSPYYHILYKNRDMSEAQQFIDNLAEFLHFTPKDKLLDLACGKGRHAIYLNSKGFDVTGVDLSPQSIVYARQFGNERLHFDVHDMRQVYKPESFDYVLNMFTSFGYFEGEGENSRAIAAAAANLCKGGKLVMDFMNTAKVIDTLVPSEDKVIDSIHFYISREVKNNFIVKTIEFEADEEKLLFQERVKAITLNDFMNYFQNAGLTLLHLFGDYELNTFDPARSDRMIFIAAK